METCVNHPERLATARCTRCFKPLCDECQVVTDMGVFCSQQCYELYKQFNERAAEIPKPKKGFLRTFLSPIKKIFILIGAVVILYFVITLTFGSPEEFFGQIRKLINIIF